MPRAALAVVLACAATAHAAEPVYVQQLDPVQVTTRDGVTRTVDAVRVWRFLCFGDHEGQTQAALESIVHAFEARRLEGHEAERIGSGLRAGLDVQFDLGGAVPPEAPDALAFISGYFADLFPADDVQLRVDFDFVTNEDFLGAAGSVYFGADYPFIRGGMVDNADADDTIQALLPEGQIPVYTAPPYTLRQIETVYLTSANFAAIFGDDFTDYDCGIVINADYPFDYDASDGVDADTFSILDILVHEVGHSMGFTSLADNDVAASAEAVTPLDMYRFRSFDEDPPMIINPDGEAEFTSTPRFVVADEDELESDLSIVDFVTSEYPMSDTTPRQASHFSDQNPAFGLMDPTLAPTQTFAPDYFTIADREAFDAIGWDRVVATVCAADINGDGFLNNTDINQFVTAFIGQGPEGDYNGDGFWNNTDINLFVTDFLGGCG